MSSSSNDNNGPGETDTGTGTSESQNTPPPNQDLNWGRFMEVVHSRKVDVALWATRLLTIIFAFFYMIPIMG